MKYIDQYRPILISVDLCRSWLILVDLANLGQSHGRSRSHSHSRSLSVALSQSWSINFIGGTFINVTDHYKKWKRSEDRALCTKWYKMAHLRELEQGWIVPPMTITFWSSINEDLIQFRMFPHILCSKSFFDRILWSTLSNSLEIFR